MPHSARKKSSTGYYHAVPKGRANQLIFEGDEDKRLYLQLLEEGKRLYSISIPAYCLMSNHTHIVLEDEHDHIGDFMKYVHERYAMKYSERSGRSGGIFINPYWSEPIETDNHLLCAVRYVHANPAAAGLCSASEYEWSSAKDYMGRHGFADTSMVLEMLGGSAGFIEWSKSRNDTASPFPGSHLRGHMSDGEAYRVACSVVGKHAMTDIGKMSPEERTNVIAALLERLFPVAQLSRITGVSQSQIHRIATCAHN